MFWRYNIITGSRIETLLDKENVTLKELMDEDDILQECKAQTKKLLDFLIRPEILDEMITLITEEPSEELDERQRYKYSNTACELLTFDVGQINDALVNNVTLLNKLYNFLNTEKSLNPLLASFFSKTMGLLISKRTEPVLNFLKTKDFITLILNHIETSAIMDLLLRFVTSVEDDMRNVTLKWLNEQKLIERLIGLIDVAYNEDFNCNASHALCDIIKACRENMSMNQEKAEPEPLLEAIESVQCISDLLSHIFKDPKKESAIVNGVLVLLALLEFKKQGPAGIQQMTCNTSQQPIQADIAPQAFASPFFRNSGPEQMTALDAERLNNGVNNVLLAVTPYLPDFHNLLLNPPIKPAIILTIGCLDPPLGYCRLEVAHLLTALLSTNNHNINVKLASLGTVVVLIDLFFKYSWNNFLHTQVEQAIQRIVTNAPTVDEEGNKLHPLLDQILIQNKITVKIIQCFEDELDESISGVQKKGFTGHLTKIANHIAQNVEVGINSDLIEEKLKVLPKEHYEKWGKFVKERLAEINRKNSTHLVGGPPAPSSTSGESVDFSDIPFGKEGSLHLAFSDYQMHEMTSNFVDQFGFNDDEFGDSDDNLVYSRINPITSSFHLGSVGENAKNAELFEEVCRSRSSIWFEKEQSTAFSTCFRLNKSTEENSSDSDEESQVFESESSTVMTADETKMDVDHQATFESVPMDVVPVALNNPWESSNTSTAVSDDQSNWADFSNFASFGASSTGPSDAMETSESGSSSLKNVSLSANIAGNIGDAPEKINSDKSPSYVSQVSDSESVSFPTTKISLSKVHEKNELKASNKQKDMTALFDEETCSATSIQNGPV